MKSNTKNETTHGLAGAIMLGADFVFVVLMYLLMGWWALLLWIALGSIVGIRVAKREHEASMKKWIDSLGDGVIKH